MNENVAVVAILSVCLIAAVLSLGTVSGLLVWAFIRKAGERDQGVAIELARAMTDAWNSGMRTDQNIRAETLEGARQEVERMRAQQHWSPAEDNRDHPAQSDRVAIAEFGSEPPIPEMRASQ
jgi:hypothetical protein